MKKIFFLLTIIFISFGFSKSIDKVHKVVVLKDWKPYYSIDKKGKPAGYAIDLFEKIALNIGLNYEYIIVDSWKDANRLLENKQADIIPNIGKALKRADYLDFTQTTDIFEVGLFKHKSLKDINSKKQIKDFATGVVVKNLCLKLIDETISDKKVIFKNYHSALSALESNEIDILCYPKNIVNNSINELNLQNIESFEEPLKVVNRAIGIRKGEEHLLELFDKELLRIKGNQEFQTIYNKWFLKHKDIEIDYEELILVILLILVMVLFVMYYIINSKLIVTKNELDEKINDISELKDKQLEQQKILLTQTKVAAVGEMLGNIAHQWRQPLTVITTRVSGIQADLEFGIKIENKELENCANDILYQSEYLSKTIDDFRNFFSSDMEKISEHDLKEIILNLKSLVESSFKNNFIQYTDSIEDNINIKINDNLLIQALMNICNNSKDALIEHVKDTDFRYFFIDVKKDHKNAIITFKDSAGGIKDNVIDKIFEPYFTTKHKSIGTGIGLYMTNQIITKQLKGNIQVSNEEFEYNGKSLKGAKFIVTIPLEKIEKDIDE